MSTASQASPVVEVQQYLQAWANSCAEAFGAESGVEYTLHWQAPVELHAPGPEDVLITVISSGDLAGSLVFRIDPATALQLARSEEFTAAAKAELLEHFRRLASLVSARLQPRKCEFQLDFASELLSSTLTGWFRAALAKPSILEVRLSPALAASLQGSQPSSERSADPKAGREKLGMLMEVELETTVRFGGRRMLLKDILDLCAGSVVELNQQVQEPVELLLDGKLIARGEVVVVDGNYGLRVTELVSTPGTRNEESARD